MIYGDLITWWFISSKNQVSVPAGPLSVYPILFNFALLTWTLTTLCTELKPFKIQSVETVNELSQILCVQVVTRIKTKDKRKAKRI